MQSDEADQVGSGLEHQLPQLYSHFGTIVVVQRVVDEPVFVVLVFIVVVGGNVGAVVGTVVGVVVGAVGLVVEVVVGIVVGVVDGV